MKILKWVRNSYQVNIEDLEASKYWGDIKKNVMTRIIYFSGEKVSGKKEGEEEEDTPRHVDYSDYGNQQKIKEERKVSFIYGKIIVRLALIN